MTRSYDSLQFYPILKKEPDVLILKFKPRSKIKINAKCTFCQCFPQNPLPQNRGSPRAYKVPHKVIIMK